MPTLVSGSNTNCSMFCITFGVIVKVIVNKSVSVKVM